MSGGVFQRRPANIVGHNARCALIVARCGRIVAFNAKRPRLQLMQPGSCLVRRTRCSGMRERWRLRNLPETFSRPLVVMPFLFDEDESPTADARCDSRRARACKRIEHDAATRRIRLDEREQRAHGFLRGVAQVPGVIPRQHIAGWMLGNARTTLRQ